ncbi:AAEL014568-PA [Aedes aegypti]|uniref:AAEL014568-PA n=1 Tax=Aedes aegypti TaxID=7159 RepID=Q16G05_AEDAE|nr:AAEL014568-PA [Aedes aegypti]
MSLKTSEEISLLEPLQFQSVDNVEIKGRDLEQSTDKPPEEASPENGSSNLVIEPGVGVLESFQQALNNILSSTTPTPTIDVFAPQSLLEQLGIPGPEPVDPTSAPDETVPSKGTRNSPRIAVETSVDADKYSTSRMSRPAPSEVPRDNLFQIVGTQFANVLESNSGQQFQNVTSQIAGEITNATNAFTGSSNSGIGTGIQSQLQQLINSITPSSDSKPASNQSDSPSPGISQDSIFQQLGSQVTNPFGINAANGSSITNPLQPVTSQLGTIGNQFAGAIPNATNLIVGTNGADIQSQLQQLINIVGPNRTKPQSDSQPSGVSQDSFFQQLGSQFNNFFSTNNSAVSNPLGSITSQFQNVSSQIAGGITNVSNTFTGSSNSANSTATDPFGVFTSQFQNVGTQITGGITNVTNAFTGSSNTGNSSSFLTSLQNQLLSLLGNTSSTSPPTTNESSTEASSSASTSSPNSESSTDSSTTQPANDPIFPGILQPITIPFGNNGANQSSSSSPFNQIQNIGFSNATSGLLPNAPIGVPNTTAELQNLVNQLSPSSLSQTSNQVVDALKPSSIQGQLQGIGSQLEANIPNVSNDAGILNSLIPNILNWNSVSDLLLPSSLLTSSNNNLNPLPLPFLCPVCTPVCGKANPHARVAGGVELTPSNKYPWTARIMYFGTDVGQGTLINDRAVVTTATIVKSIPIYTAVTVLFNVFDKTATTEQRLERRVANVYTPLLYNPANIYDYNIGIIRLATPVTFSTTFMPICLPKYYDSIGGTSGTLVGWGAQTPTGAGSNKPREVSIPLYTDRECQLSNSRLTSNNLCGGVIKPASDAFIKATCKGDDGAALMYPSRTDATVLTLLGVAIDVPNQGCGETNQLSVFSKVYNNLDFIVLFGSGCGC